MNPNPIRITFHGPAVAVPGGRIAGVVEWHNLAKPSKLVIRLFWLAENQKGGRDLFIVSEHPLSSAQTSGRFDFDFPLPDGPPTFEGNLIKLEWGVEAAARSQVGCATFVMAPEGRPVRLKALPEELPDARGCLRGLYLTSP